MASELMLLTFHFAACLSTLTCPCCTQWHHCQRGSGPHSPAPPSPRRQCAALPCRGRRWGGGRVARRGERCFCCSLRYPMGQLCRVRWRAWSDPARLSQPHAWGQGQYRGGSMQGAERMGFRTTPVTHLQFLPHVYHFGSYVCHSAWFDLPVPQ